MSRVLLEKAVIALLNEQHDKAEELFHTYLVQNARKINESFRNEDADAVSELEETYFTEEDMYSLEEADEEDLGADDASDDLSDDLSDDSDESEDMDLADDSADLGGEDDSADFGDDMDGDVDGDKTLDDRLDDLTRELQTLTSEFEKVMAELTSDSDDDFGGEDGDDFGGDDMGAEDAVDGDAETASDEDGDMTDDMSDEDDKAMESVFEEDEFEDFTESVLDELETIKVPTGDGRSATGGSLPQNKKDVVPAKSIESRQGGSPIRIKSSQHKGFERETPLDTATPVKLKRNVSQDAKLKTVAPADKAPVLTNVAKTKPVKK